MWYRGTHLKSIFFVLAVMLTTLFALPPVAEASLKIEVVDDIDRLQEYKWNNRLVLILLNGNPAKEIDAIISAYSDESDELEDRQIVFILLENKKVKSELVKIYKKRYKKNMNGPYVIIGLDGEIKRTRKKLFTPKRLYKFVDSMPMRKSSQAKK